MRRISSVLKPTYFRWTAWTWVLIVGALAFLARISKRDVRQRLHAAGDMRA